MKRRFLTLLVSATFLFTLGVMGPWVNEWLLYTRLGLQHGEWWRAITGHWVHLGVYHALMNTTGLVVIGCLFNSALRIWQWLAVMLLLALLTSIGLYVWSPHVHYYAGLSGVLHGLLVIGLILQIRYWWTGQGAALAVVVGKLAWEQRPSYNDDYLQEYIHAPVVVDAHLYGAVAGAILAAGIIAYRLWIRRTTSINVP